MEQLKKVFNLRIASLIYALLVATSFHLWDYCDSYKDLPSQDGFLWWIIALYAVPTVVYSGLVVHDGIRWRLLQPQWVKAAVVCVVSLIVAAAVYSLYTWYPELNYWIHKTDDKEVDFWYNEFTNQYLDYDRGYPALRTMQWRFCYSHITAIALALLVLFRLERFWTLDGGAAPAVRVAARLTVYFLVLGYLLFNYATITVVPYLMLIYVINCTDFFERHHSEWFQGKIAIRWFFWTSVVSLIVLSYFLSSINEEFSAIIAFAYMVIALLALIVGLIAGFVSKSHQKTFYSGAVWGFSIALIIPSSLYALVLLCLFATILPF